MQQDVLSSRHLPPTTLPSFGTRVPGNLSSDSSTHLRSAKASHIDRDTDLRAELQEVIQQNRVLEENQTAILRGAAPTSPIPVSHGPPNSGLMSPLTIHQPFPSMPTGDTRGPWSTTRDRIHQQQLQHHPGITIPSGVPGSEPSFGPLSGGASAGVPAFPLLQSLEWPIRPWLLHNLIWYHLLRCQKMTSRERSCLSLSFR